ncbi:hypothetical protein DPMN_034226 [Dreissena polymorpha]|uniref:Uncharacterized protein n=1 Tax=Dreissena polymorpha TaxID=45954 RepID=A0A9D4M8K8_DREPO|nr:hypothetical protein DPMN_034226 [Dreissena polymorpha]
MSVTRITFTIGPIRQEDLSTPELNKLMAMAQRFEITFDTVPILDTEHSDKLGYITLPFEIRTQDYLLVLYDRLNNLKLGGGRDVSVKFPDELRRHVDECRAHNVELKKKRIEEAKEREEKDKKSIYATFVDKDTGRASLVEKFPEAKEISVRQHNFQWFGVLEFETVEEAQAVLKKANQIEIEGQKVKIVKQAPDYEEKKQLQARDQKPFMKKRPQTSPGAGFNRGPGPAQPLLGVGFQRGGDRIGHDLIKDTTVVTIKEVVTTRVDSTEGDLTKEVTNLELKEKQIMVIMVAQTTNALLVKKEVAMVAEAAGLAGRQAAPLWDMAIAGGGTLSFNNNLRD